MRTLNIRRAVWHWVSLASVGLVGCASGSALLEPSRLDLATLTATRDCASLRGLQVPSDRIGLPTRGARVTASVTVAAKAAGPAGDRFVQVLPAYCQVQGEIAPIDPKAGPIRFQVNIPLEWNQRALHLGGGGLNGRLPDNLAAVQGGGSPISGAFPPDAPYPLTQGYSVYGSDSGHQEPGLEAHWAMNAEAWENFGHASLKKTHDAVFAVIEAMYASRPKVSYFMGNSQGGREALEVAQRYPNDYDGVVATAPLIGYTAHVVHKTLLATKQTGAGWIPSSKLQVIGAEVNRQCDALDGIADGVISHHRACRALFDPVKVPRAYDAIRCAGGADTGPTCISDAQIRTLHQMHARTDFGYPLANGWTSFAGYGTGRESLPGFLNIQPQPRSSEQPALGQPGSTVRFGIIKDPGFNLVAFDLQRFKPQIQAASALIDSTNPDLSRFFARGGRLIIKSSPSDYSSNPQILMEYFDAVVARSGRDVVDRHVRYYLMPNTSHGGDGVSLTTGAPIPQHVNLAQMAFDWVEKGVTPPDAPVARAVGKLPPFEVSASKPMCRYPMYPHYRAGGDPKLSDSYECRP